MHIKVRLQICKCMCECLCVWVTPYILFDHVVGNIVKSEKLLSPCTVVPSKWLFFLIYLCTPLFRFQLTMSFNSNMIYVSHGQQFIASTDVSSQQVCIKEGSWHLNFLRTFYHPRYSAFHVCKMQLIHVLFIIVYLLSPHIQLFNSVNNVIQWAVYLFTISYMWFWNLNVTNQKWWYAICCSFLVEFIHYVSACIQNSYEGNSQCI